jgi:hypothetical protein
LRPAREIAGERLSRRIGDEVEHRVAALAGAALGDDLDEAGETALVVLLRKAGDLGVERGLGLLLDEIRGRPVDEGEEGNDRGREDDEVERGQSECIRPQQPPQRMAAGGCGRDRVSLQL